MPEWLLRPWPWYVSGPLIGLMVPALLLLGNKSFGISSNLRHLCAAIAPRGIEYFRYDWKRSGLWNLTFLAGVFIGGVVAARLLGADAPDALAPAAVFSWAGLFTWRGVVAIVVGGFLVGSGASYAGGCTSGHSISGLAALERASLLATASFFVGGVACSYLLIPLIF